MAASCLYNFPDCIYATRAALNRRLITMMKNDNNKRALKVRPGDAIMELLEVITINPSSFLPTVTTKVFSSPRLVSLSLHRWGGDLN